MNRTNKALAAASALLLGMPTAAFSHTNSIGYVGDGTGGVTFWYGTYHSPAETTFNEGELKLEGANGTSYTTTINQFNLLETTLPAGLDPSTNYFTTDGTQLVPWDANVAPAGGTYTWQGFNVTGLSAGDYTFTYIPLGDAESYDPTGSPTMQWAPIDNVIRTYTVSLSAGLISGDANGNGILDILEFGTQTTPTLVSSATNPYSVNRVTTITDTPSEADGVQTVDRTTRTDTTTTYATVDTYSDGSTTTTYSSSTATTNAADKFTGRIDQYQVLDKVGKTLRGALNHTPSKTKEKVRVFSKNYLGWAHGDYGYYGTSTVLGTGVEIDVKPTWTIGGQYNNVSIDLTGADSTSSLSKEHFGVFSMMRGNTLSLRTNAGYAFNNYSVSRNVAGVFNNDSASNGQEWWVNNRLYLSRSKTIQPFLGHTVSNVRRDAFSENGSVQSARTVEEYNKTENVGEVGVNISHRFGGKKKDKFGIALEASVDTNTDAEFIASVDYNQTIYLEGLHQIADGINNTQVAAKVKFRF